MCGGTIYTSHPIKSLCTHNSLCVVVHYMPVTQSNHSVVNSMCAVVQYIPVTQSNHCVLTTVCVWWYNIYQSPNQITVYNKQSVCGGTIYTSHPIKSLCTDNSLCVVVHYMPVTQSNHCVLTTVCVWWYIICQSPNQIIVY